MLPPLCFLPFLCIPSPEVQGCSQGAVPPQKTSAPPVFAEQWHRDQLSQFAVGKSTLLPPALFTTLFHSNMTIFAHCTWQKPHFSGCQKCSVTQKCVKNAFPAGAPPWTPLGELTMLPRSPTQLWGDTPPETSSHSAPSVPQFLHLRHSLLGTSILATLALATGSLALL